MDQERLSWLLIQYGQVFRDGDDVRSKLARTAIDEFINADVTSLAKQLTEVTNRRDRLEEWAFKVIEWLGIETLREDVVRAKIISMHTDAARIAALEGQLHDERESHDAALAKLAESEEKHQKAFEDGLEIVRKANARISALESESAQYREAAERAEKECERLRKRIQTYIDVPQQLKGEAYRDLCVEMDPVAYGRAAIAAGSK